MTPVEVDLHTPGRLLSGFLGHRLALRWVLGCQSVSDCRIPRGRQSRAPGRLPLPHLCFGCAGTS